MIGRLLRTIPTLLVLAAFGGTADAADWMFRRSYFSHAVSPEEAASHPGPASLSAYRPAIVSPYPGFGIQNVQRFNRSVIRNGASVDVTLQYGNNVRYQP